jgi:hypothetical protein
MMTPLSFAWSGPGSLAAELAKPLTGISIETFHPAWGPSTVKLWRSDGTGLKLFSRMHNVAERLELGVLNFELLLECSSTETVLQISPSFSAGAVASKLVIHEADTTAESGLAITASDGNEIIVVASAGPCYLAVGGVLSSIPHLFEPEYPLDQYVRVPV